MQPTPENDNSFASLKTCNCAFCGREFQAKRASRYCSKSCSSKAWTAERSRKRALRRGTKKRVCSICGKPFEVNAEHLNQKFCSYACKKRADRESRSKNRLRKDVISLGKIAETQPLELDALREEKGEGYFKILFSLSKEKQFAEMDKWGEEDHKKAMEYLGLQNFVEEGEEERVEELLDIKETEKSIFDEEDHFGDL